MIDLGGKSIGIDEPFVTIAGQTAPSPGITLIRGGLGIHTHDVVVQHIRVRRARPDGPRRADGKSTRSPPPVPMPITSSLIVAPVRGRRMKISRPSGPRFDGDDVDQSAPWHLAEDHVQ